MHRGRGQNFPIFISCRYLVELGLGQLGLPVADLLLTFLGKTDKEAKFSKIWGMGDGGLGMGGGRMVGSAGASKLEPYQTSWIATLLAFSGS